MLIVPRPQFNHARYIHPVYGAGIGSIFGRLFARVASRAARTGLKTAIATGSKIARKGINKVTQKTISHVTKKGIQSTLKGTLKHGLRAGKSFAKKQLKTLPKKAINYAIKKSKDPKTQQSIQKAITKGAKEVIKTLVPPTDSTNTQPPVNTSTQFLKQAAADTIQSFLPPENSSPQPVTHAGVKRKRTFTKTPKNLIKRKKRKTFPPNYSKTDLNSLIART